ncbi:hypothetical protein [Xenorhabdus griffiniae]|uniref:hypothetical protein n=1 Tax=Xenorhabdus griffiniae TaxID=351672 RepID=UPI0023592D20|nr:hypothetical protein [Xenorhabdus griffiniae]MDC9606231.1 hypothetical protein [Xenorhabdus griffiniae]
MAKLYGFQGEKMNIENNMIKLSVPCLPGKLCVSIPDNSDIIIGQSVYLTVSLIADPKIIENIQSISIKNDPIVIEVMRHVDWTPTKDKTGGSAIFLLNVKSNILPEKLINYSVHAVSNSGLDVPEVTSLNITYTAKTFSPYKTISLEHNKNYLVTPTIDNNIDDPSSEYILMSSIITGDDGEPLKNVAVTISSSQPKKLNLVVFATDDKSPQPIALQSYNKIDFITVYSDSKGEIRFRIYPIKYTQIRLDLTTAILNVTGFTQAYTLYVINSPHNLPFELGSPTIQEMGEGNIIKQDLTSSSKYFHAQIPAYQPIYATDGILFFIRSGSHDEPKLLEPIYKVNNVNELTGKAFSLSYSDLPINERGEFYYLISPIEGRVRKSYPITLEYVGNDSSNNKVYDKVKVYTSHATLPIDVYSEVNETFEWHGIILSMINRNKKPGQSAKGVTGLYVVIMGTNDQNNKNLPQLGSTGYLNVYIKTPTSRNTHKSYQFSLSTADSGKQTGHVVVNIPYCDINRAGPSFSKGLGTLSFDYYIENSDGSKTYSKKWTTQINTVLPNQAHDDNDGCDPL